MQLGRLGCDLYAGYNLVGVLFCSGLFIKRSTNMSWADVRYSMSQKQIWLAC